MDFVIKKPRALSHQDLGLSNLYGKLSLDRARYLRDHSSSWALLCVNLWNESLEMVHLNDEVYGSIGGRCSVFIQDMPYSP
jgi:hypothetical protein